MGDGVTCFDDLSISQATRVVNTRIHPSRRGGSSGACLAWALPPFPAASVLTGASLPAIEELDRPAMLPGRLVLRIALTVLTFERRRQRCA